MPPGRKIQSVLELAKHRIGDTVWWVVLRPIADIEMLEGDLSWMDRCHPKVFFDRGYGAKAWGTKHKLPKVCAPDFKTLVTLLTGKLVAEQFTITHIVRSTDTGEFIYFNSQNEWIPEDFIYSTKSAVNKERQRVQGLVAKWANGKL